MSLSTPLPIDTSLSFYNYIIFIYRLLPLSLSNQSRIIQGPAGLLNCTSQYSLLSIIILLLKHVLHNSHSKCSKSIQVQVAVYLNTIFVCSHCFKQFMCTCWMLPVHLQGENRGLLSSQSLNKHILQFLLIQSFFTENTLSLCLF